MTIGVVLLIVLCNMSSFRASKVLISLYALELGASQFYIGIMIAMYSLLPALLAVHAGKISDRFGVRLPMLVGSLGIVGIPCEVFTEIGLEIKRRSPLQPTFNVSLANGYNGYLPTPQQHRWGGYETWRARSSYLEVTASDTITKTVMELLTTVAKTDALK